MEIKALQGGKKDEQTDTMMPISIPTFGLSQDSGAEDVV
jgi:hypothetical protein